MSVKLYGGDCLDVLPTLPENSVDTCITDPPYGLSFMGKDWDHGVPGERFWREVLRVLKPGATMLCFGGDRTHHRLMVAVEDAGFEIRTCIYWVFGSGFPKSHDISKAIDKAAGAERDDAIKGGHMGISTYGGDGRNDNEIGNEVYHGVNKGAQMRGTPVTDAARLWDGWGTALKPAVEIIVVAMKPIEPVTSDELYRLTGRDHWCNSGPWANTPKNRLKLRKKGVIIGPDYGEYTWWRVSSRALHAGVETDVALYRDAVRQWREHPDSRELGARYDVKRYRSWKLTTFAANALKWGVAGLNIDGARVEGPKRGTGRKKDSGVHLQAEGWGTKSLADEDWPNAHKGRWPSNLIHDGSEEVVALFPTSTQNGYRANPSTNKTTWFGAKDGSHIEGERGYADSGSAARFFKVCPPDARRLYYAPKASRSERNAGLEGMEERDAGKFDGGDFTNPGWESDSKHNTMQNFHPTVKPLSLMQYLCRLTATPTAGVVLDPFMGSGSTGCAAVLEGRDFIGIELDAEYVEIARRRIAYWQGVAAEQAATPRQLPLDVTPRE